MPADPVIALYDEFAPDYERTRVPRFRPFVKRLLQLYDTRPGSFVIDAGCGTGMVATMVAPRVGHGGRVLGVDASAAMLEIARHKAGGFGFDQCEFVVGDILRLDAPENWADLVTCSFALWGKPAELFAEFHRVLKPHGTLLLQNWALERGGVARTYGEALRAFVTNSPDEHLQQVRAIFSWHRDAWTAVESGEQYVTALRTVGFASASAQEMVGTTHFRNLDELIEFHDQSVRARAEIAAMDKTTREGFRRALEDALQPLVTERGIDEEWHAIQVVARK